MMEKKDFMASYEGIFDRVFDALLDLHKKSREEHRQVILEVSWAIAEAFKKGNKVLIFGNGGSAADAQHLAAEFVNRFLLDRDPLPAIALHTDTSVVTSVSNDFSFSQVFSKQINALGLPGDVAWGISTSGNSENVVEGLIAARRRGLVTVGFSGVDGGAMKEYCDHLLNVDSRETPRIQEIHIVLGHIICETVENFLFGRATG